MTSRSAVPPTDDKPTANAPQGVVLDERGQEQPADKQRAQLVERTDRGDHPPGDADRASDPAPRN